MLSLLIKRGAPSRQPEPLRSKKKTSSPITKTQPYRWRGSRILLRQLVLRTEISSVKCKTLRKKSEEHLIKLLSTSKKRRTMFKRYWLWSAILTMWHDSLRRLPKVRISLWLSVTKSTTSWWHLKVLQTTRRPTRLNCNANSHALRTRKSPQVSECWSYSEIMTIWVSRSALSRTDSRNLSSSWRKNVALNTPTQRTFQSMRKPTKSYNKRPKDTNSVLRVSKILISNKS